MKLLKLSAIKNVRYNNKNYSIFKVINLDKTNGNKIGNIIRKSLISNTL